MAASRKRTTARVSPAGQDSETPPTSRHELSGLDLVAPRTWLHVHTIYELSGAQSSQSDALIQTLQLGLAQALADYRSLAGRIRVDDEGTPWISTTRDDAVEFTSQTLDSRDIPSLAELEQEDFAQELLDASVLLPPGEWTSDAGTPKMDDEEGVVVSAFQASLITGGLVLSLTCHQMCCDATALYSFASRWIAVTYGLWNSSMDPARAINGKEHQQPDRAAFQQSLSLEKNGTNGTPSSDRMQELTSRLARHKYGYQRRLSTFSLSWQTPITRNVIFHFSPKKVASLVSNLSKAWQPATITTIDVILALVYKAAIRSRMMTFHAGPRGTSELSLGIDLRASGAFAGRIPADYLGNATFSASTEKIMVRDVLTDGGLARLASTISRTRDEVITPQLVGDLLEWTAGADRKIDLTVSSNVALSMDLGVVDWRCWAGRALNFGLGVPKAVRHGNPTINGMAMVLPSRSATVSSGAQQEEGVEVLLTLEQASMERVLQDKELLAYATPLGAPDSAPTSITTARFQLSS